MHGGEWLEEESSKMTDAAIWQGDEGSEGLHGRGGVCTYFVVIFQVARNPLKLGKLTRKHCPHTFFHEQGNKASNMSRS